MTISKPEDHFHEHREKEYVTQYFPEVVGVVKQGPTTNLVMSLVKFRTSDSHLNSYIDLRYNSYSVQKNKYYKSKKGITIPKRLLADVINALNGLSPEPPTDLPKEGNRILARFEKYKNIDLVVSLTIADGSPKVDIREWVRDVMHGYEGFTYKGVRFNYDLYPHFSSILMKIQDMISPLTKDK